MDLCVREARFNREGLHEAVVRSLKEKLINILRKNGLVYFQHED
jgi:hypothetical protein